MRFRTFSSLISLSSAIYLEKIKKKTAFTLPFLSHENGSQTFTDSVIDEILDFQISRCISRNGVTEIQTDRPNGHRLVQFQFYHRIWGKIGFTDHWVSRNFFFRLFLLFPFSFAFLEICN